MNLFELTAEFVQLRDMEADIDADIFADTMEDVRASLDEKIDGYHAIMIEWDGLDMAADIEIRRLQQGKKVRAQRRALLNENIMICLDQMGEKAHKTALNRVRIAANPPRVCLDVEPGDLPEEFRKNVEPEADKKKIAAAIKIGRDLTGLAHLEQSEGVRWS